MNRLMLSLRPIVQVGASFVSTDPWRFFGGSGEDFVSHEAKNPFAPSIGTRLTELSIQTLIVLSVVVPILSVIG